ncbi:MAG: ABC transporter permease [Candidatus Levybacteria bacterium]|nr:ABC transporter permease [Candidatus Levybacteria bacterium]
MEYKEIIQSALQALRINILRTSLTMLGIIIGITSVILIYSIGQGAVAFITNELSSFGTDYFQINPGGNQISTFAGSNTLTFEDVEAIRNDSSLTNIKYVVPFAMASETVSANGQEEELLIYGSTHEAVEIFKPELTDGSFITEEQENASERVAVIGTDAAEKFFGEDSSPVGETIRINNRTFRITGVTESTSVLAGGFINNALFIPIGAVTDQILGEKRLQEIDVSVYDQNSINQTLKDVEDLLRDRHGLEEGDENDFQIQSAKDILSTVQTVTGLLTAMIVAISGISLVVGGIGVMNIMLVSVTERTKEIGLLKAIGAKQGDILSQFLIEAVVMTSIGGIIGIILGTIGALVISLIFKIPFIVSAPAIIIAVGVSSLVGIIFGLYPARRAAKLSPIDALRYE